MARCKLCDSDNTGPDIKVDGRQRFKCLDCKTMFFDDGESAEPKIVHEVTPPVIHAAPAEIKATIPTPPVVSVPDKIYHCKKCEYSDPDRYKLVSHYSSVHSWWHRDKESQIIEAYKRGDRVLDIYRTFGIRNTDLYHILHKAKVLLRSQDPNHPASSMETRRQRGADVVKEAEGILKEMVALAPKVRVISPPDNGKTPLHKLGRPRLLPQCYCKACGKPIFPRPYRVRLGRGNYCRQCSNKLFRPPKPIWVNGKRISKEVLMVATSKPDGGTEDKANPEMSEIKSKLASINELLTAVDLGVGDLLTRGTGMTDELKIDIILAFLESWQKGRPLASKLLQVIRALENLYP